MKKILTITVIFGLGLILAYAQPLGQFPNLAKPNDSLQILAYKTALAQNGGLPIPAHDAEVFTYSGSNVIEITYKVGGINGVVVAKLVQNFSGSNVIDRSLTVQ